MKNETRFIINLGVTDCFRHKQCLKYSCECKNTGNLGYKQKRWTQGHSSKIWCGRKLVGSLIFRKTGCVNFTKKTVSRCNAKQKKLWIRDDKNKQTLFKIKMRFFNTLKISLILPSLTWQDWYAVPKYSLKNTFHMVLGTYTIHNQSLHISKPSFSLTANLFRKLEKLWPEHIEGRIEEQVEAAGSVQVSIPIGKKK
jgi:hypothetical protein